MKKLPKVRAAVEDLGKRRGVSVDIRNGAWIVRIPGTGSLICEITVPIDWCFEWFVSVKTSDGTSEIWSDWEELYGSPDEALDAEMAAHILSFGDRAAQSSLLTPISLDEERP